MHGRAQGLIDVVDGAKRKTRAAGAEDERCDHDVNTVKTAGSQKARYRLGAALDQYAAQASLCEACQDCRGRNVSIGSRQRQNLCARQSATGTLRGYHNPARILDEEARMRRQPPTRIKNDSDRIGTLDVTNRKLRIIRARRFDTHENGIDQRPQAVQVRNTSRAVNVMRTAGCRCHATVERLADLTDDDEVVDFSGAERPEYVFPWLGQRSREGAELVRYLWPGIVGVLSCARFAEM